MAEILITGINHRLDVALMQQNLANDEQVWACRRRDHESLQHQTSDHCDPLECLLIQSFTPEEHANLSQAINLLSNYAGVCDCMHQGPYDSAVKEKC